MSIVLFIIAASTLCLAQIIRVLRWKMFIEVYEEPRRRNLIQALAFGNLINLIFPFRIAGDLFRAVYSGKKMKNKYAFSLSTVIVDRILDVIMVGIIFSIFMFKISNRQIEKSFVFYILFSISIVVVLILVYGLKKYIKIISLKIASLFNQNIELNFLKFMWSLIWNFKDIFKKINKIRMVSLTISMWLIYLFSYYVFSLFLMMKGYNFKLVDIFIIFFSNDTFGVNQLAIMSKIPVLFYAYILISIIEMLIISIAFKEKFSYMAKNQKNEIYLNLLPNQNNKEKLKFLEKYFMDNDKTYIENYLKINQNINIIRDFSAGSNATTMLCMKNDKMI